MGWFDQKQPKQPLIQESKYTVQKVSALCDQIGPLRLQVDDVSLKIVISSIAWGVLPYLSTTSNGQPGAALLSETITKLEMLVQVLEGYISLQNSTQSDKEEMLKRGYTALSAYAQKISNPDTDTAVNKVAFEALTDYLAGNQTP